MAISNRGFWILDLGFGVQSKTGNPKSRYPIFPTSFTNLLNV
jgi:hypothetical protein